MASILWSTRWEVIDHLVVLVSQRQPQINTLDIREHVSGSAVANMPAFLDALARGLDPMGATASAEVVDHKLHLARSGATLDLVTAGYRLFASCVVELWTDTVAECDDLAEKTKIAVIKRGTAFALIWTESVLNDLGALYREEVARLAQEHSHEHVEFIRSVLDGSVSDVGLMEKKLGVALTGQHQCLVLRSDLGGDRAMELKSTMYRINSKVGVTTEVNVLADQQTVWTSASSAATRAASR